MEMKDLFFGSVTGIMVIFTVAFSVVFLGWLVTRFAKLSKQS